MSDYATVEMIEDCWRPLSTSERTMAARQIHVAACEIRNRARMVGKDFDAMVAKNPELVDIAASVVCDVVRRYLNDIKNDAPAMSQVSQAAGGYSVSSTFLVPGGGLFVKESEYKRLGLKRQKIGVISCL